MTDPSPRAVQIIALLVDWPRKRVTLEELWRLLDHVDPATRGTAIRRRLLADTIAELVGADIVAPPAQRSFDRTQHPPLPLFVSRRVQPPAVPTERPTVWHPELAWAVSMKPTQAQAALLGAVNLWLFRGGTARPPAPLRERSLEITGNEKAFDGVTSNSLFSADRLTLDVLRAYRVTLPLYTAGVGDGPVLLIIENSDTFDSLRRALTGNSGSIGRIGWGAGAAFESSVLSTPDITPLREIRYFGDLDAAGLRIPASASRLAVCEGLPAVQPATGLYTALFATGRPQTGQPAVLDTRADELTEWLDDEHRGAAHGLLVAGHRLAQEEVNTKYLTDHAGWRALRP